MKQTTKPSKSTQKRTVHADALAKHIIKISSPAPGEEDFWALVIMLTNGKIPIFAMNGPIKGIAEHTMQMINAGKINITRQRWQIMTFQGEKAHWAMSEIMKTPGMTTLQFPGGDIRRIFPTMAPTTTLISLDEQYVSV